MVSSNLRHALRAGTRASHERLDALVGELDSRQRYGAFLSGLHAFRAPLEAALATVSWPRELDGWRPRSFAAIIAEDLRMLGLPVPAVRPLHLSNDSESLIGISYVLEGASLGARVLVRQIAPLGLDAGTGARHLHAQAADIGNWRAFIDLLGRLGALDVQRTIAAANAGFDSATTMMRRAYIG